MKNKLLLGIKIVISFSLLSYLLMQVDIYKFKQIVSSADVRYLLLPIAVYPISLMFSSVRWKMLLNAYGLPVLFIKIFRLYWEGSFFNNFLPASIGGDSYKFFRINLEFPGNKGILLSSILWERGLGVMAALIVACFFAPLIDENMLGRWWSMIAYITVGLGLTAVVVFVGRSWELSAFVERVGIAGKIFRLMHLIISFPNTKTLFACIVFSVMQMMLSGLASYFLFLCFGVHPSLLLVLYLNPLVMLAALLPISINNFGVAEAAGYYLYSFYGVSPEFALLVYFVNNILLVLCTSTGGLFLLSNTMRQSKAATH